MRIRSLVAASAAVVALTSPLMACSAPAAVPTAPSAPASAPPSPVRVDVPTWISAATSPGTVIVDVRTPEEFAQGHVEGALNIPVESSDFAVSIAALNPSGTFAIYCRSGRRSAVAAEQMAALGYVHVYDLEGGFADLEGAGMPSRSGAA